MPLCKIKNLGRSKCEGASGYFDKFILSKNKQAEIDIDSLELLATYTALQHAVDIDDRLFLLSIPKISAYPAKEVTMSADNKGVETPTNEIVKPGLYWVPATDGNLETIHESFKNGVYVWAFPGTSINTVVAVSESVGNASQVQLKISSKVLFGSNAEPEYIELSISFISDIYKNRVTIAPDFSLDILEQTNGQELRFVEYSKSATSLVVDAVDANGDPITDLNVVGAGFFSLIVAGTAKTVTGITRVGNRYSLAFATASGAYSLAYPLSTGEIYECSFENALLGTF